MLKTIQSWGQKVLAFKKAYVEGRSGATAIEYVLRPIIIIAAFKNLGIHAHKAPTG
jgi:Flp pilus assembly pilin Flp